MLDECFYRTLDNSTKESMHAFVLLFLEIRIHARMHLEITLL